MNFKSVIENNEDRDICISMEFPDGGRRVTILKHYRILENGGNSGICRVVQPGDTRSAVDLFIDPVILSLKKGIIMITIIAICYNILYRIYITDDIIDERFRF